MPRNTIPEIDDTLSIAEVAELADCDRSTVRRAVVDQRELAGYKNASGYIRIKREDAVKWAAERKTLTPITKENARG